MRREEKERNRGRSEEGEVGMKDVKREGSEKER